MAYALGIKYLFYPTDNRITYTAQSEAYVKFSIALKGTEAMRRFDRFWKNFVESEQKKL